jgi:hypothetical protein
MKGRHSDCVVAQVNACRLASLSARAAQRL